jgi:hypothetical protein
LRNNLPEQVRRCVGCIEPDQDEEFPEEHISQSIGVYNAFMDNDSDTFQSDICKTCGEGLVPSWLPQEQVIRYIKNIFSKHDLQI